MRISNLKLNNFRNYNNFEGEFSPSLNLFVGDNAQGKTNFIEAIYIIGATKSFRRAEQDDFIKINEQGAIIKAVVLKKDLEKEIIFKFIANQRKEIIVNNKRINKSSDYIGNINITLFSPDDLLLIKGDASYRRRFIDALLCQTDKLYLTCLINYQRVLKQRNTVLKEIKNKEKKYMDLEPWDEQLCEYATEICIKRDKLSQNINEMANKVQKIIKNSEDLSIQYIDSIWQGKEKIDKQYVEAFKDKLREVQKEEITRGTSLIGPHRDNLEISINQLSTRYFGSQGQQRSAAISMKMAEVEYIYHIMQEYPVLLLDDIFSELDDNRKHFLFNYLNQNIQIFLTGTRSNDFKPLLDHAMVYEIHDGQGRLKKELELS